MIIGVTGRYAAGKDTVAEILQKMNFFHVSFSDLLREELQRRKEPVTRNSLIHVGNELREKFGADVLARRALDKVKDGENYAFTSIRNPSEAETLLERPDFLLINVTASEQTRFKRMIMRNREGDPQTLADLRNKEALESSSNPAHQQLHTVVKMAKVTLLNEDPLEVLQHKVQKLVQDWMFKLQHPRPDWDTYFMNIAEQVKTRASCMSSKKGSIIVQNKMIISTGYNGTPKSIKHCTAGACQRCTSRHLGKLKSGEYSEPCICSHAEENAIVQASYNGTSTKGATLYTTFTPCTNCAKMIINAGIVKVLAKTIYPDDVGTELLKCAGVLLKVLR